MSTLQERARRAYEWARLRRALVASIPVAALVTVSMLLVTRPDRAGLVGVAVVLVGVWSLWRGVGLPQAFAAGVTSGLVPLLAVSAAMKAPHACAAGLCISVCLPAAGAGGLVAGVLLGLWQRRFSPSRRQLALGFAVMVLTGAMACACIGLTGVAILLLTGGATLLLTLRRAS
ncbi:MAG: hypothetical protein ACOZQL_10350 [Myxococcota bacterium]